MMHYYLQDSAGRGEAKVNGGMDVGGRGMCRGRAAHRRERRASRGREVAHRWRQRHHQGLQLVHKKRADVLDLRHICPRSRASASNACRRRWVHIAVLSGCVLVTGSDGVVLVGVAIVSPLVISAAFAVVERLFVDRNVRQVAVGGGADDAA